MITFYCVGFPDLDRSFNAFCHVQDHKIYLDKNEAEKEVAGKVVAVHEFHARNQAQIDSLISQHERMLARFK
mgnify:CR=1 FL=1